MGLWRLWRHEVGAKQRDIVSIEASIISLLCHHKFMMPLTPVSQADVICRTRDGREVAHILIVPVGASPLAQLNSHEARAHNEAEVQLVENGYYEYKLISKMPGLSVACRPIFSAHRLQTGEGEHGALETSSYCGQLRIEVVHADTQKFVGSGAVEVRSVKLGYRDDYRWMLDDIAGRMQGLLFDARVSAQMPLTTAWPRDAALLQQQVAFLCETVNSTSFHAAVQRILTLPHHQLTRQFEMQSIRRAFKTDRQVERQLAHGGHRVALSTSHALARRLSSLPECVHVPIKHTEADTTENQFVKHVLVSFRDFLRHAEIILHKQGGAWHMVADRAQHAANELDRWLSHTFFQDLSPLRAVPFDSHVLQRKTGYREVLRAWLRFGAGAQLQWNAADDLFRAGQRNVAVLYEYWLFFQLLDWFCARFVVEHPPATRLIARDAHGLIFTLRQGVAIEPFEGTRDDMRAQFCYNRTFDATSRNGSWTRQMRPDFTFTFWRDGAPTHLHFDAKYRVNALADVFADFADDDTSNAHREDLLKMHAYRDAIRHTAGAYVLYPGNAAPLLMRRDEGVFPGLGAFAVAPGADGKARGMAQVGVFLEEVIASLL